MCMFINKALFLSRFLCLCVKKVNFFCRFENGIQTRDRKYSHICRYFFDSMFYVPFFRCQNENGTELGTQFGTANILIYGNIFSTLYFMSRFFINFNLYMCARSVLQVIYYIRFFAKKNGTRDRALFLLEKSSVLEESVFV